MNIKKGLVRLFILLSCAAMIFGGVVGFEYAQKELKPTPQETFATMEWDEEAVSKYFSVATHFVEQADKLKRLEAKRDKISKQVLSQVLNLAGEPKHRAIKISAEERRFLDRMTPAKRFQYESVDKLNLAEYNATLPKYNWFVLYEAFPDASEVSRPKLFSAVLTGAAGAFMLSFAVLQSILAIILWVYKGFKDA